jgi:hypothetical protein
LCSNFATQLLLKLMAGWQATVNGDVIGRCLVLITPVQKKKIGSVSEKMKKFGDRGDHGSDGCALPVDAAVPAA